MTERQTTIDEFPDIVVDATEVFEEINGVKVNLI